MPRISLAEWDEVADLITAALEKPVTERRSFLRDRCGADELRLMTAERLLGLAEGASAFLQDPAAVGLADLLQEAVTGDAATPPEYNAPEVAPARIGPYRILHELGRGGMGVVYLAERDDAQFRRSVAIKIVRVGASGVELADRFRRERQILASLDHPNIARLFDGGVTEDGRPYLVMEVVEGEPIDRFCDARRYDVDQRLALFEEVCRAVGYAHRKLIVHRDLKPANILVDASGNVKLLDFGVAKLLAPEEEPLGPLAHTRVGLRVLTPEYASPEQFLGERVSTASDVYSLGVLLFALLAGTSPYKVADSSARSLENAVLHDEPDRPSAALFRSADATMDPGRTPASTARNRGSSSDRLRRRLRGDLDTIVMTALRKDPDQRYASVDAMLDDVRRHRARRPIVARPQTWTYRTGRFIRRNRIAAGLAALLVVALGAGAATTSWQARTARVEARKAEQIRDFLVGIFEVSDPDQARGETITARELLDRGAERMSADLAGEPALRAQMAGVLGTVYGRLGLFGKARQNLEEALRLRRAGFGTPSELAGSLTDLASVLLTLDAADSAESMIREALAIRRRRNGEGSREVAAASLDLAAVHRTRGEYAEAAPLYRESVSIYREAGDSISLAKALNGLGLLLSAAGEHDESQATLEEAVSIRKRIHGELHSETARTLCNLAAALSDASRFDRAVGAFDECLQIRRRILDGDHPDIAMALNNLGMLYQRLERVDDAERLLTEALEIRRRAYGAHHTLVAGSLNNLAVSAYQRGDYERAAARFAEILEVWRARVGEDHPNTITTSNNLGMTLREAGDLAASEAALQDALAARRRVLGDAHPDVAETMINLSVTIERRGRVAEAEALIREGLARLETSFPQGNSRTAAAHSNLGRMLLDGSRFAEAVPHLDLAVRLRAESLGEDHLRTAESRLLLGRSFLGLARFPEAEAALQRAHAGLLAAHGADHERTREAAAALDAAVRRVAPGRGSR